MTIDWSKQFINWLGLMRRVFLGLLIGINMGRNLRIRVDAFIENNFWVDRGDTLT